MVVDFSFTSYKKNKKCKEMVCTCLSLSIHKLGTCNFSAKQEENETNIT